KTLIIKTDAPSKSSSLNRTNLNGAAAIFLAALFVGCSEKSQTPQTPANGPKSAARDKVVIKGSNTVGEELAPRLVSEYKKDHPNVKFDLESKGTGSGF